MRCFRSEPDGGFTADVALARFERLEAISRARAEAGRRGADSKHGGKCLASAVAIATGLPASRPLSALTLSSGSALALERSSGIKTNTSARKGISLVSSSAGARAPEPSQADQDRCARIRFKLATATFPWAAPTERRLPNVKVYELGGLEWATEILVDFVLSRVVEERPAKPLGFIFSGFGWNRRLSCWGAPWDVPLVYRQLWESRQEQLRQKRAELAAAQERINVARASGVRVAGETA